MTPSGTVAPSRAIWRPAWLAGASRPLVLALAIIAWLLIPTRAVTWTASNFRPLTSTAEQETYPALSPEGTQIVYATRSNAYGARDLYLRNVNEGTPVQLTSDASDEYGAAWSPDGSRIAFARSVDDQPCALVIMPIPSGAGARRHALRERRRSASLVAGFAHARCFPIARYPSRCRACARSISKRALSTTSPTPSALTMGDTDPQAAPDGHHIAFRRTLITGADDLLVLDTRNPANSTPSRRMDGKPRATCGHPTVATSSSLRIAAVSSGSGVSMRAAEQRRAR